MKLNKALLISALSLVAATGLIAKPQVKEEVPGVAPQPASYFYTGKPYDADLGAYTFNFRNYDPEMRRWTSADPRGFPDGANNLIYINNQINGSAIDPDGCNITYSVPFNASYSTYVGNHVLLDPSTSGVFTYVTSDDGMDFIGAGKGDWQGPPSGHWSFNDTANSTNTVIATSAIKQLNSGTQTNSDGMIRDWIEIAAYFTVTTTKTGQAANTVPIYVAGQVFYGAWYE
jgi:RHS repeat-associated protein